MARLVWLTLILPLLAAVGANAFSFNILSTTCKALTFSITLDGSYDAAMGNKVELTLYPQERLTTAPIAKQAYSVEDYFQNQLNMTNTLTYTQKLKKGYPEAHVFVAVEGYNGTILTYLDGSEVARWFAAPISCPNMSAIIGGAVGGAIAFVVILVVAWCVFRPRKHRRKTYEDLVREQEAAASGPGTPLTMQTGFHSAAGSPSTGDLKDFYASSMLLQRSQQSGQTEHTEHTEQTEQSDLSTSQHNHTMSSEASMEEIHAHNQQPLTQAINVPLTPPRLPPLSSIDTHQQL